MDVHAKTLPGPERLQAVCRRYGVRSDGSDIDLLAEFNPQHRLGMVGIHEMEQELSKLYGGRRIHLLNRKFLNPRIRDRILAEAQLQFAER